MNKRERQKFEIDKDKDLLKIQEFAREMEDTLRRMGIQRSHRGPRISSPTHTIDTVYSSSTSNGVRIEDIES